jgi:hypothetical protein
MLIGKCKNCNVEAEAFWKNMKRLSDLDTSRIGTYCTDCFPAAGKQIKDLRFVEEYKDNKIYSKDGMFAPYWQSSYCFSTVEGARERIDNRHMAYGIDPVMFKFMLNNLL